MLRGLTVDRGGAGRGSTVNRGGGGRGQPAPSALDPLLAEAVLLLRASSLSLATYTPGDDWPNEGTAGSAYDAVAGTGPDEPPAPGAPELVDDGGLGFSIDPTAEGLDFMYVPHGAAIEFGAGSFTAFARIKWTVATTPGLDNIMSKLTGQLNVDMHGWQLIDMGAANATAAAVSNGGTVAFTNPALTLAASTLSLGEHLLVMRLDRATDELALFVDGTKTTSSAAGVATVAVDHQLIFGRGKPQIGRAYGCWDRALSDVEVARLSDLVP